MSVIPLSSLISPTVASVLLALGLVVYIHTVVRWRARTRGRPLPPGPKALPLLGNVFNTPTVKPWFEFQRLCRQYGDVVHLHVFGHRILVLGSADAISEYLDKRSANTSSRHDSVLRFLTGADILFAFMPYGSWWRRHRRIFWQHFHPGASEEYRPLQTAVSRKLLSRLLKDPSRFKEHIRYAVSVTMMKVLYDNEDDADTETQMHTVALAQEGVGQGLVPGKFLVEYLPFLRHLPPCFLGPVMRKSPEWRKASAYLKNVPSSRSQTAMMHANANAQTCVLGRMLAKLSSSNDAVSQMVEEDVIRNTVTNAFEAGADTMFSSLHCIFLAMSLHPHVLTKAQAELDAVVGPNRLPDFSDRESLAYVNAIIKESSRWLVVLALGLPHCTTADDEFRGYFIPAGTVLLPNTWACMHDTEVYGDPEVFRPERFIQDGQLNPNVRDPAAFVFGYGRRICPGRYFAEAGLFINAASALHVFNFTPPLDENGKPIKIEPKMSDGLLSYPEDCRFVITPRSEEAEALISSTQVNLSN